MRCGSSSQGNAYCGFKDALLGRAGEKEEGSGQSAESCGVSEYCVQYDKLVQVYTPLYFYFSIQQYSQLPCTEFVFRICMLGQFSAICIAFV